MNPTDIAINIAAILDHDPIVALQVKNYISTARLVEVLGLKLEDFTAPAACEGQLCFQIRNPLGELEGSLN